VSATETITPTILVVDDDPDIRELVQLKLDLSGFTTVAADDGETALRLVADARPDLVVLDVMMPGLSGFAVCERLREDPATARLPVILLTAKAQESDLERGFAAGATDYLVKPFSPRELVSRVNAALARSE
jgi:DNA-binding response OmpR family regulator